MALWHCIICEIEFKYRIWCVPTDKYFQWVSPQCGPPNEMHVIKLEKNNWRVLWMGAANGFFWSIEIGNLEYSYIEVNIDVDDDARALASKHTATVCHSYTHVYMLFMSSYGSHSIILVTWHHFCFQFNSEAKAMEIHKNLNWCLSTGRKEKEAYTISDGSNALIWLYIYIRRRIWIHFHVGMKNFTYLSVIHEQFIWYDDEVIFVDSYQTSWNLPFHLSSNVHDIYFYSGGLQVDTFINQLGWKPGAVCTVQCPGTNIRTGLSSMASSAASPNSNRSL